MKTYPPWAHLLVRSARLPLVSGSCFLFLSLACLRLQGQTCNDLSQVSLDADCVVEVTPDMVLEGTPNDASYVVHLKTQLGIPVGNTLTAAFLGDTLVATVIDTLTGNSCWGLLVVEDHWAPTIICANLVLPCALPQFEPDYLKNTLGLADAYPGAADNCGDYGLTFWDLWTHFDCSDVEDRSAHLQRTWTATDGSGNQSTCVQYITVKRVHVNQVSFPADTIISCEQPQTAPAYTGQPFYTEFGVSFPLYPDAQLCGLSAGYQDQVLTVCAGSYKILRTWTVHDDCLPTSTVAPFINPLQYIQVIKVLDTKGPVFQCPHDTVVATDPFYCSRSLDLPDVIVQDNCAGVESIRADWTANGIPHTLDGSFADFPGNNWWVPDTLGVLGVAENLPAGIITFRYILTDRCGNTSTCSFRVTVSDGVPPLVACDEFTQVALGPNGTALVNAETFDDGSIDNCSPVHFKARRVDQNDCQANDRFFDTVKFCCADVGDTIAVILRVYDLPVDTGAVSLTEAEGHANDCLVHVFVVDKLKPVCQAPINTSVSCANFDPGLQAYGAVAASDNCCLDTVYELPPNYSQFDTLCNRGTIFRNFRAIDCHGLSSQCSQRVIVQYEQNYSIKFPDDVVAYDCDTTDVYSPAPEIFDKDCELIAISYQDVVGTGGVQSCYRIERRWQIINWCTYNSNLPLIEVPNPNPNPDPLDEQNLPGPIMAPPGHTPASTIMRVFPNDPFPTDYGAFWKADANGYLYRQIITVKDNQPPKIRGCPQVTKPIEFCDHTTNDPNFWNAWYWVDPHIPGSHDLCEGMTELAVTASDGCSKGNINIRYLLYLDLDGDGVTETVINSINPPPANTVYYGNALTPNFSGGQARAFDQRPVPLDEKYRFTIQTGGYVNVTGYVRWVSDKDPTKYIAPQLPHGVHRIQWIIEDGCGNETVCEYPIWVRDCRSPELVCLNGLSVDIAMDKKITIYANDLLVYLDDNCTPANQVKLAISKSGTTTNFPLNPDGTPRQSVTFTCDELGPQFVQLWAMDAAGNFNMCETYVIVQDNFGVCPATKGTVSGVIQTEGKTGVEDVNMHLSGTYPALPAFGIFGLSDYNGAYRFTNALPFGAQITLAPSKDNDPLNGVSTFDLVLINKHILGIDVLQSPYKIIAADANNSGSVTTFDVVELRKLILGIYTSFPDNESWRFVDKSYTFPNPGNPFQEKFPETRFINNLFSSAFSEDFVAVKVGDVNGNAVTNSLQTAVDRSSGTLLFDVQAAPAISPKDRVETVKPGDLLHVHFQANQPVAGVQFTLLYPGLEVVGIMPDAPVGHDNFAVFPAEQALTMSWDGNEAPSFTITFRAQKAGRLNEMLRISSQITKAEAYGVNVVNGGNGVNGVNVGNGANGLLDVALRFQEEGDTKVAGLDFEVYPNQPNPWRDRTRLRFYLPEAQDVTLTVFNESGALLYAQTQWFNQGYQTIPLQQELQDASGVLYYRLETADKSVVQKMIRIR